MGHTKAGFVRSFRVLGCYKAFTSSLDEYDKSLFIFCNAISPHYKRTEGHHKVWRRGASRHAYHFEAEEFQGSESMKNAL